MRLAVMIGTVYETLLPLRLLVMRMELIAGGVIGEASSTCRPVSGIHLGFEIGCVLRVSGHVAGW